MALSGKRILIVEDEVLIALMAAEIVRELGATVVGPAHTLDQGLIMVADGALDGAILDVSLRGVQSAAIAKALTDRSVPFVLATGQAAPVWALNAVRIDKPFSTDGLASVLEGLFAPPS